MTKLVVGSATDVGLVRSNNQDQYLVAPGLYAVADGMGGHAAGEVASQTAIEALRAAYEHAPHTAGALVDAAKTANRAVWDQARANRGMLGMGTTLVALAVVEENGAATGMAIAHIGDSRVYMYRDGGLTQLTVDHSLVQELIDDGQLTVEQAAVHPQRHVLTRALGVEPSVEVDLLRVAPHHGDRYLLCSDGLPREASDDQIAAVLSRFADPSEAAKELVSLANSRGGSDNVTVVVVDVMANDATGETLVVVPGPASSSPPGVERPGVERPGAGRRPAGASHQNDGMKGPGQLVDQPDLTTSVRLPVGVAPAASGTVAGSGRAAARGPVAGAPGGPPASPRARRAHGGRSPRPVTWRVVGFVLALALVVGAALAALAWYARSTYYVTFSKGHIAIYQGRPGGVLWFDPTLSQRTVYTKRSVLAYQWPAIESGQTEPSLRAAREYIHNLVAKKLAADRAARPPVPTQTTTSAPSQTSVSSRTSAPPRSSVPPRHSTSSTAGSSAARSSVAGSSTSSPKVPTSPPRSAASTG